MKKRKHLLVLTDVQLAAVMTALKMEIEDYSASNSSHPRGVRCLELIKRQRCEGLSQPEQTWAMEEIVRLGRASKLSSTTSGSAAK